MSHFCVAVVTKDINKLKEILDPYSENLEVEPYIDEEGEESSYNPKSKWDWYEIGGRYNNRIVVDKTNKNVVEGGGFGLSMDLSNNVEGEPNLKRVNGARIKDIHFDKMGGNYDEAIRYWELVVEGKEPQNDKEKEMIRWNLYKPEYYIEQYGTKEKYAKQKSMFSTWALVDEKDWYEQGEMGWFAMSDATQDSRTSFVDKFQEYINSPEHQDEYMIIVDCHI